MIDLSDYELEVFDCSLAELLVTEFNEAVLVLDLVKVVQVELTDKRGVVFGLKVLRKDLHKLLNISDHKRVSIALPMNHLKIVLILKHFVCCEQEVCRALLRLVDNRCVLSAAVVVIVAEFGCHY